MLVPCPLPYKQWPKQPIGDKKLMHPVDASDFSEAESEVVTKAMIDARVEELKKQKP